MTISGCGRFHQRTVPQNGAPCIGCVSRYRDGFRLFLVLAMALSGGFPLWAQAGQANPTGGTSATGGNLPTLTRIAQIRGMSLAEATRGYPVRIRALVTYCRVSDRDLFIQDSTGGVWVDPAQFNVNLRSGQWIEVVGFSGPGDFAPEIDKAVVQILGHAPYPPPRRVNGEELATGRQDSQWVEVEAVVRSAVESDGNLTLNVAAGALQFRVFIPDYGTSSLDLVDAVVRIRGVFGGTYTSSDVFTGFQLVVPFRSDFQIVRKRMGGLFSLPVRPLDCFLRFTPEGAFTHRVRVQGVVTYHDAGLLYICGHGAALRIHVSTPAVPGQTVAAPPSGGLEAVKVGDLVDVVGFPDRGEYTPVMRDAVFRRIGAGAPTQPARMSAKEALKGAHDADLIQLKANLLNRTDREGLEILELQDGETNFRAEMAIPSGAQALPTLRAGSLLELTGVRRIEADENRIPHALTLVLRSKEDIVALRNPPWWTRSRVLMVSALLLLAVLGVLTWVGVLRHRVHAQTEVIRQRLESEAALEKRYQRLFERNLAGVCRASLAGQVLDCNDAFATMLGYDSRQALLGRQISGNLMSEADRRTFLEALRAEKKLSNRETRLRRKDGSTLWVIENATLVSGAEARSPDIESTCIDITERKKGEADLLHYARDLEAAKAGEEKHAAELARLVEALRESEERYRELFENASDVVYTTDLEARLTSLNRVGQQLLGYSPGEVRDSDILRQVAPQHREQVQQGLNRLLAGAPDLNMEAGLQARDGRRVKLEVKSRLIYKDGKPVGMQAIGRDITGRDVAELELRQAQKLESVGRLASGIAHEINTPIQFVGDNTRFLQDSFASVRSLIQKYREFCRAATHGSPGPELVAAVEQAEKDADCDYLLEEIPTALAQTLEGVTRVATIVRAMKEFAHPEDKELAAADLNRALLSTLTVARNELKYVADVQTAFGELPPVVCNISDLNQVFLNLLVNAAHAIGDVVKGTGGKGTIRVRTAAEDAGVLISIADTGGGIPEAIRSRIYDPFFTTKEVGRGTGQGLAIARSVVVDRHKGSLTFESEVGKGTTFFIRLPLDPGAEGNGKKAA